LAISATKIISSMFAPIPAIHETHWYLNSLCNFSLCTVNTVTHCYDTLAVLPQLLLDKDRQKVALKIIQFFFSSPRTKFYVQTSGWMNLFK
jgi:hypothetical protein